MEKRKEIKIKDVREVNILGEIGSNEKIISFKGTLYELKDVEEYAQLLESKKVSIVYQAEVDILDKEEKRYLSNLIRPFRDKVTKISKIDCTFGRSFIQIEIEDDDDIDLPIFERHSMYKGMESDKGYTLEELGL